MLRRYRLCNMLNPFKCTIFTLNPLYLLLELLLLPLRLINGIFAFLIAFKCCWGDCCKTWCKLDDHSVASQNVDLTDCIILPDIDVESEQEPYQYIKRSHYCCSMGNTLIRCYSYTTSETTHCGCCKEKYLLTSCCGVKCLCLDHCGCFPAGCCGVKDLDYPLNLNGATTTTANE